MGKSYVAAESGFVAGIYYKEGDAVPVTEKQAKYLAPPYGDKLSIVAETTNTKKTSKTTKASTLSTTMGEESAS